MPPDYLEPVESDCPLCRGTGSYKPPEPAGGGDRRFDAALTEARRAIRAIGQDPKDKRIAELEADVRDWEAAAENLERVAKERVDAAESRAEKAEAEVGRLKADIAGALHCLREKHYAAAIQCLVLGVAGTVLDTTPDPGAREGT